MQVTQLLFLLIVFGVAWLLAWLGIWLFAPLALRERLRRFGQRGGQGEAGVRWIERVASIAKPLTKLSIPEEGWEKSTLRTRFMNAGWRSPSAPTLYFASKTALALLLPFLVTPFLVLHGTALGGSEVLAIVLITA